MFEIFAGGVKQISLNEMEKVSSYSTTIISFRNIPERRIPAKIKENWKILLEKQALGWDMDEEIKPIHIVI